MSRRIVRAIVIALAGVAAFVKISGAVVNPPYGTRFVVAATGPVTTLDPTLATWTAERDLVANLFDRLVVRDRAGKLAAGLASSWSASPDQLRWTFDLVAGARFTDGTSVDAAAVVASWQRGAAAAARSFAGMSIAAESPSRVVITLDQVVPDFPARLADPIYSIVREVGSGDGKSLVGSGPFRLAPAKAAGEFRLLPRLDHPRGRPAPGEIRFVAFDPRDKGVDLEKLGRLAAWIHRPGKDGTDPARSRLHGVRLDPVDGVADFTLAWIDE